MGSLSSYHHGMLSASSFQGLTDSFSLRIPEKGAGDESIGSGEKFIVL